ncbi:2-hydroxyacid dehydrogenase [Oceanospirillum sediminis]|uniref:2-hydroxyacid dehydrogenase n=1 Tax=Oceanospirillum sediminis TaxID=2760088 RepID=A0A839IPD4_9GAMM|nr:2-hydroxyacid dehydrogenase [Oceanospirillum sediminis]MBB1486540.1 2-hydroxyacid dehydrogenase [Oceanospirillum sediminis]
MRIAVFSAQPYDQRFLDQENHHPDCELVYFNLLLNETNVEVCKQFDAVCAFVNDDLSAPVLKKLKARGVRYIALRCAGFNNVDLLAAKTLNLPVVRVPAYSPEAVAEHTLALILGLNRKTHKAFNRVREQNFSLNGLLGFNLHGRTVGLVGTGQIGIATARILKGFGCRLLACDPYENDDFIELGGEYVSLNRLYQEADIITLHCPLTEQSQHLIDEEAISHMKDGVMLINTSRGGLVDTQALVAGLKTRRIGALGLDVYEQESELFFHDHSGEIIDDELFQRLLTFPNVMITGHQGFFTEDALTQIARTTLDNLYALADGQNCVNELTQSIT